jgi:hypothetical protein
MADGTIQILLKHKLQELRRKTQCIVDLSFENLTNNTQTANILDNKNSLSGSTGIDGYTSLFHLTNWSGYGDRLLASVFDSTRNKMVSFLETNATRDEIFCFTIDNSTNVATYEATISLPVDLQGTGHYSFLYSNYDDKFYMKSENSAASTTTISRFDSDFTNYTDLDISSFVGYGCGWDIDETNGRIYLVDSTLKKVSIINLSTFTLVTTQSIAAATQPYFIKYNSSLNKIYVSAIDKLYVMDGTSYVVTEVDNQSGVASSDLGIIDNMLIRVLYRNSTTRWLQKWNMQTDTVISQTIIETSTNGTGRQRFWIDNKKHIWCRDANTVDVFSLDGRLLQKIRNTDIKSALGLLTAPDLRLEGIFENYQILTQQFNPANNSMWLGGNSYSQINYVPKYVGGTNGLTVTTSACSYNMVVTEFNTEPILVTYILLYYKNGGNSLNNLLKYLKETSTGGCDKRVFQPRAFISATDSTDKVIEIDLCDRPLVIDTAHYFKLDIPAGEKITMVLFYKQAQKKDLILNKLLG